VPEVVVVEPGGPSAAVPSVLAYHLATIVTPSGLRDGTSQRMTFSSMSRIRAVVSDASR
jgi:hypothetical protein